MKKTLERFAPPGFPYGFELSLFLWGLGLSFLYSLWFFADFFQALADFQTSIPFSGGVLYFGDLEFFLRHTKPWLGYVLLALVMAGCVIWNYSYHYQGSKSVYLMRRLPTPRTYHLRCLTIPLVCAALSLLLCLLILVVCGWVYETWAPLAMRTS